MANVLWDCHGITLIDYLDKDKMVTDDALGPIEQESVPKMTKTVSSDGKVKANVFWDCHRVKLRLKLIPMTFLD